MKNTKEGFIISNCNKRSKIRESINYKKYSKPSPTFPQHSPSGTPLLWRGWGEVLLRTSPLAWRLPGLLSKELRELCLRSKTMLISNLLYGLLRRTKLAGKGFRECMIDDTLWRLARDTMCHLREITGRYVQTVCIESNVTVRTIMLLHFL